MRTSSCSARAGTFASRLPCKRRLERRLLDAQSVGVGRDHPQLLPGRRHQNAGQHRPRLVARGRTGDAGDRLHEGFGGKRHARLGRGRGKRREVLGAQVRRWNVAGAADQLDVLLGGPQLHRERLGRERASHVEQQPRRQHGRARAARPRPRAARAGRSPCRSRAARAVSRPRRRSSRRKEPARRCASRPPAWRSAAAPSSSAAERESFIE